MLFMKNLQERDSGTYTCEGVYANNEKMVTRVSITTFSELKYLQFLIIANPNSMRTTISETD